MTKFELFSYSITFKKNLLKYGNRSNFARRPNLTYSLIWEQNILGSEKKVYLRRRNRFLDFFSINLMNVDCIIEIFSNFMRIKIVEQQKWRKRWNFTLWTRWEMQWRRFFILTSKKVFSHVIFRNLIPLSRGYDPWLYPPVTELICFSCLDKCDIFFSKNFLKKIWKNF